MTSGDEIAAELGAAARRAYGPGRFADITWIAQTASTNTDLVERARRGEPEQVLLAELQTAGRGRLGRRWEAGAGTSVLMSVLVRTDLPVERLGLLSPALGLAVVDAVRARGGTAVTLSWPNDVIVPGGSGSHPYRKLAGILADAVVDSRGRAVVVGVGVNVDLPDGFATERNDPVGLADLLGGPVDRPAFAADVLARFATRVDGVDADGGRRIVAEMAERCWTIGRDVVVSGGADLTGRAIGIDDTGRLLVRAGDTTHSLDAGDVSVR